MKGGRRLERDLRDLIRNIPDFPKKGILFRDITTLLKDSEGFKQAVMIMADHYRDSRIDKVPIRKPGKLPADTVQQTYELEYGTDTIEVHQDGISPGERILLVDDLLATGGTAKAAVDLIEKLGGKVISCAFLIGLDDLPGRDILDNYDVFSVISYD
jgi:adenine phosphoribosyltransferase